MSQPCSTGILLAGGIGSRFKSATPKVAHDLLGRPLVAWPAAALRAAGVTDLVVVAGAATKDALAAALPEATQVVQDPPRGTGDAARVGMAAVTGDGPVLIAAGDTPCLQADTLTDLVEQYQRDPGGVAVLSARVPDPSGYGRIVRDGDGRVTAIVEHKDANDRIRDIDEVNVGVYVADAAFLREALAGLDADNAQGELYLVDILAAARKRNLPVLAAPLASAAEMQGVNDRAQLAAAAAILRDRLVAHWQAAGVTFVDPATTWLGPDVELAADVEIGPGVGLHGRTRVDTGTRIEAGCQLTDTAVGRDGHLKPYVITEGARLHAGVTAGPFAHLRPGSELMDGSKVGNFVETKNTVLGPGSKANHLSYLGDATIGARVNVGAGTITCNYDGVDKHPTVIEDDASIGSDTMLVAPVKIGRGAFTGAGTTVTKDVRPGALAISRGAQKEIPDYERRRAKRRTGGED